jgi:hypothetical protein
MRRTARIEGVAFEEMRAPLLDEMPGDGIRIGIGRGHACDALRRDLVLRSLRQLAPHQRLGHIESRRDQNEAGELITSALAREVPREQQRDPPTHGRADDDARAATHQLPHRHRFFEPIADAGVKQIPAREPMAGIIEARHGEALLRRPFRYRRCLGARHLGEKA